MAAARLAVLFAAAAVAMAAALPLLAADECFDNCFKQCVGNDKAMTDYCNFACGMTCGGGGGGGPPVAGAPRTRNCQLACVRDSCLRLRASSSDGNKDMQACYGQCYDGCEAKATGAVGAAALPDHPFHHNEMQDAVQPTSEPDPDDASRRARGTLLP